MTDGTTCGEGPRYEINLADHLDDHWSAWFGGSTITHEDDGTTTLRGDVTDQAELHGLLAKVRDLGATLNSLTVVHPAGPGSQGQSPSWPRASPRSSLSGTHQREPSTRHHRPDRPR